MTAMLINPRLSLLCLVVGSFMGLWSGDKQPSIDVVIAQAMAEKQEMLAAAEPAAKSVEPYEAVTVPVTLTTPELELPAHVAPGFYRAVNHAGEAQVVQVREDAENRDVSSRDFYTHEADGQRWYLIRLDNPAMATSDKKAIIR